jgi:hypothetical protein
MFKVHGPEYRYQGERLSESQIIVVYDHHYDEHNQEFPVKKLLENSVCDPLSHVIIFDHVVQHDDVLKNYNLMCVPAYLSNCCRQFNDQNIVPDWNQKTHTFNFMINKKRLHREILLLLIEHFKLNNYTYSLVWQQVTIERNNLLRYTNNSTYRDLISTTEVNIPTQRYLLGQETLLGSSLRCHNVTNSQNYQHLLQKNVFEPSCISLITEPAFFEKETIITEKTVMALWGGTIPIWIGGWRIPDYLRSKGFDMFDDLVDHSYQSLDDPLDRCYSAIEKNLQLLCDHQRVLEITQSIRPRLQKNLNLLIQNCFMQEIQHHTQTQNTAISTLLKTL